MYAFSAAGVVHAVARACAAGRLRKCHCAEAENEVETRQTWRWGGCGDNLAYAKAFARKFLDAGSPTEGNGRKASNPSPSVGKSKMKKKVVDSSFFYNKILLFKINNLRNTRSLLQCGMKWKLFQGASGNGSDPCRPTL